MFAEQLRAAITAAPIARLPELGAACWKAFSGGALSEAEAEEITLLIEARKAAGKSPDLGGSGASGITGKFAALPPRKVQRPPVRSVAVERRRRLAASGPLPPALASRFTTGEAAVLRIVGDECRDKGRCVLPLDAIAARAGVGRTTAQNALRLARRLGMVEVEERRLHGAKNLPNRVTVADPEWRQWLARGAARHRVQESEHHGNRAIRGGEGRGAQPHAREGADSHKRMYGTRYGTSGKCSEGQNLRAG